MRRRNLETIKILKMKTPEDVDRVDKKIRKLEASGAKVRMKIVGNKCSLHAKYKAI